MDPLVMGTTEGINISTKGYKPSPDPSLEKEKVKVKDSPMNSSIELRAVIVASGAAKHPIILC